MPISKRISVGSTDIKNIINKGGSTPKTKEVKTTKLLQLRIETNLINEIDSKDTEVDAQPSTKIYTVVTITDIGRPSKGDIAYSKNTGKFKGYVSLGAETSWQDLN